MEGGEVLMPIRQRKLGPPDRPLFNREDASFLLELPVLASIATFAPETRWHALCVGLERLKFRLGRFSTASIKRGLTMLRGSATDEEAFDVAAMRSEHHVQILRDQLWGWKPKLVLSGSEHVDAALKDGRGAVLWVAHFCFNALATKIAFRQAGYPVSHMSRPEHGFSKSRFGIAVLNPLRVRSELRYLRGRIIIDRAKPSASVREASRRLAQNEIVSITAGAWEGARLVTVEMAGRALDLATGAPGLALMSGAALLPVITVRDDASDEMRVIVKPRLDTQPGGRSDEAIMAMSQAFAELVVPYVRAYPMQWRDWEKIRALDKEP
jgi:lauroyl/myristoyl acyltransferase